MLKMLPTFFYTPSVEMNQPFSDAEWLLPALLSEESRLLSNVVECLSSVYHRQTYFQCDPELMRTNGQ